MSEFEGRTGKWIITYDPPPIPIRTCDWHFYHEDFDGAPMYSDDIQPADKRFGHAGSFKECIERIEEMEDEENESIWPPNSQFGVGA